MCLATVSMTQISQSLKSNEFLSLVPLSRKPKHMLSVCQGQGCQAAGQDLECVF